MFAVSLFLSPGAGGGNGEQTIARSNRVKIEETVGKEIAVQSNYQPILPPPSLLESSSEINLIIFYHNEKANNVNDPAGTDGSSTRREDV